MFETLGLFNIEAVIKLFVAFILGIIVGLEREFAGKEAGPRTYALVTVAVTLFTIVSLDPMFQNKSRIIAQIVSGIGFLGAGLIIFHQNRVRGLATAAGVWAMAAVGVAVGIGYFALAFLTVIMMLIVLYVFRKIDFDEKAKEIAEKILHKDDAKK